MKVFRILTNNLRTGNCSILENGNVVAFPNEEFGVVHVCTTIESLSEWLIALGASDGTPWYVDTWNDVLVGIAEIPDSTRVTLIRDAKVLDESEDAVEVKISECVNLFDLEDIRISQKIEFTPYWINPREGYFEERSQVAHMSYEEWEYVADDFGERYTSDDVEFKPATVSSIYDAVPTYQVSLMGPMWSVVKCQNQDNWTPVTHLFGEKGDGAPDIGYYMEKSWGSSLKGRSIILMIKCIVEPTGIIIDNERFGELWPEYSRRRFSQDADWSEFSEFTLEEARKIFWDWVKGYNDRKLSDILDEIFPDGY